MISKPQKESAYHMGLDHEGHSLLADVYEGAHTRIYFEILLSIIQTLEMLQIPPSTAYLFKLYIEHIQRGISEHYVAYSISCEEYCDCC